MISWRDAGILTCLSSTSIKLQLFWFSARVSCSQLTLNFSHKLVICQILLLVLPECCFFLCFNRIETKKDFWIKINLGLWFSILWWLKCGRVTTLKSFTPAVLFDFHLQQLLNLLFEFKRKKWKVDSVYQQPLWLAAICYHSGWMWRLYYIIFVCTTLPFLLLRLVKHLNLALNFLGDMEPFRLVHAWSHLTTLPSFYNSYLSCFYLTTVLFLLMQVT